MRKPIHEFAGWLRFFYLTNTIGLVIAIILLILLSPMYIKAIQLNNPYSPYFIANLIEVLLLLLTLFFIIRKVVFQDPSTPDKIVKLLAALILISTVFLVIKYLLIQKIDNPGIRNNLQGHKELTSSIISSGIWILYFRKSKRVKAYYGKNAGNLSEKNN